MEFRNLGDCGLKVSVAGLGCNNFGMTIDFPESERVIQAALDAGINFFDTADCYGAGGSEEHLGKVLADKRHEVVIASKCGIPMGPGPLMGGASRRYVLQACEASLKRLGTDYIDLYYMHTPDPNTPISETLDAMNTLVDQGKVRYIACSNMSGWQISEASWEANTAGLRPFAAVQNEWSLLDRSIEAEAVPAAVHHGMGVIPYFPLASGVLTGKYKRGETFEADSRYGGGEGREMFHQMYGHFVSDESLEKAERLGEVASAAGISLIELALSWLASQDCVPSVIAGARTPEQVESNAKLTHGGLGQDVLESVEKALA